MIRAYSSAVLFHGPTAYDRAMEFADELGRMIHEPFGEEGLKIDESREIIALMSNTPLGDKPGVLVIGPMDHAWPAATDVLLKTLEDFDPKVLRPVLWAHDEGGVRGTIRSRCLRQWCPGEEVVDEEMLELAKALVDASLDGNRAVVLETLRDMTGDVLIAATQVLRRRPTGAREVRLWGKIREVLRFYKPTATEIKAAFV